MGGIVKLGASAPSSDHGISRSACPPSRADDPSFTMPTLRDFPHGLSRKSETNSRALNGCVEHTRLVAGFPTSQGSPGPRPACPAGERVPKRIRLKTQPLPLAGGPSGRQPGGGETESCDSPRLSRGTASPAGQAGRGRVNPTTSRSVRNSSVRRSSESRVRKLSKSADLCGRRAHPATDNEIRG